MFVYAPELLMIGSWTAILLAVCTAAFGVACLAASVQRCLMIRATWYESAALMAAALLLIKPGWMTDVAGLFFFFLAFLSQNLRKRKGGSSSEQDSPGRQ
jgi:TRAP-type uncharacterized transport system fused permease subunit